MSSPRPPHSVGAGRSHGSRRSSCQGPPCRAAQRFIETLAFGQTYERLRHTGEDLAEILTANGVPPPVVGPVRGYRSRGSSIVMVVCWVSGPVRYRACSLAIAVAVQAEDASRVQPQEHVMRQRGRGSVTRAPIRLPPPRALAVARHLHLSQENVRSSVQGEASSCRPGPRNLARAPGPRSHRRRRPAGEPVRAGADRRRAPRSAGSGATRSATRVGCRRPRSRRRAVTSAPRSGQPPRRDPGIGG